MATGKWYKWLTDDGLTLLRGWAQDGLTDEQIAHNKVKSYLRQRLRSYALLHHYILMQALCLLLRGKCYLFHILSFHAGTAVRCPDFFCLTAFGCRGMTDTVFQGRLSPVAFPRRLAQSSCFYILCTERFYSFFRPR